MFYVNIVLVLSLAVLGCAGSKSQVPFPSEPIVFQDEAALPLETVVVIPTYGFYGKNERVFYVQHGFTYSRGDSFEVKQHDTPWNTTDEFRGFVAYRYGFRPRLCTWAINFDEKGNELSARSVTMEKCAPADAVKFHDYIIGLMKSDSFSVTGDERKLFGFMIDVSFQNRMSGEERARLIESINKMERK